jgi:hypothetical protein
MKLCWPAAAANGSGPIFARSSAFSNTVAPNPNQPVTVESTSHGPTMLLAMRCASTSTPRNGSPVTPSGWRGCVGYGPTSSLLISTVGDGGALDCLTAEPSTAVEHAAESSATETNAIYASRIRKKLPCVAPNSTHGRAVSKGN